jgi:hypothetical protein
MSEASHDSNDTTTTTSEPADVDKLLAQALSLIKKLSKSKLTKPRNQLIKKRKHNQYALFTKIDRLHSGENNKNAQSSSTTASSPPHSLGSLGSKKAIVSSIKKVKKNTSFCLNRLCCCYNIYFFFSYKKLERRR